MAIALAQTQKTGSLTSSSSSMTISMGTTTTGNLMVIGVMNAASSNTVTSVSTPSNTFTIIGSGIQIGGGGAGFVTLYYVKNIVGETTPTITVAHSGTTSLVAVAAEYSGLDQSNPLDQSHFQAGTTTSVSSGATGTLTGSNDLVVGFGGSDFGGTAYTAGAGYGNLKSVTSNINVDCGMEDKILSGSTAGQTATFTLHDTTDQAGGVVTFQASSGFVPNVNDTTTTSETINVVTVDQPNTGDTTTTSETQTLRIPSPVNNGDTATTSETVGYYSDTAFTLEYISLVITSGTHIKTWNGLARASIKTWNGLANALVKTWNGLT